MPVDKLKTTQASSQGPANNWADSTFDAALDPVPQALLVASAGTLSCVGEDGVEVVLPVIAGYNPIRPRQINTAGSGLTAADVKFLYQ